MNQAINLDRARENMVEQQIRTWEVLDDRILDLLAVMPREDFVPAAYRNLAYADMQIPIGHGEVMMEPKVEGRLLQALEVQKTDRVLEVGTGTGYLAALLASLGREVHSVDIRPAFKSQAEEQLKRHGYRNVSLEVGDAAQGWTRQGPFDAIAITGSLPMYIEAFQDALTIGGRLFVIVGEPPAMEARLITRTGKNGFAVDSLFETVVPPLQNARRPNHFVF